VLQDPAPDAEARAVQRFNDLVAQNPRLETTIIMTRNGHGRRDGISMSWVRDEYLHVDARFSRE
jgi:predicted O-methyltransferase YrrM